MSVLLSWSGPASATEAPATLPTVEFAFRHSAPEGVQAALVGEAAFFGAVHRSGGEITGSADPAWSVREDAPFGEGALDFTLDRSRLNGDLALVLRANWNKNSDAAIQLYAADGTALALDLFGNLAENAKAAATDTFVVPLTRYPQATRLSVRRLSGPLTVHAAGLFPVLSELPATAEDQAAIARQIALVFRPAAASEAAAAKTLASTGADAGTVSAALGIVHAAPAIERTNQLGASVLSRAGYPVYQRLTAGPLASLPMASSGTAFSLMTEAVRLLAIQSGGALPKPFFTSSDGVAHDLLHNQACIGLMSVPLTSAEKEKFIDAHGYPVVEFPLAHDAIEILVNAANALKEITIPQLDAIYADSPLAGAGEPIRNWRALNDRPGTIRVYGGAAGWGTTKTFQQLVLEGGDYRSDIFVADVVYRRGVEASVAADPMGIGYVSLRPRQNDVRVLAVAANSGEKAWPVDAESIYSGHYPLQRTFYGYITSRSVADASPLEREMVNLLLSDAGQAMVAQGGSLPLSGQEVARARADLGLAR